MKLCSSIPSRRSGATGFVLLEVLVSMVILGIAMATMMRSFTLSIAAIRNNDVTTQATVLAETLLQSLEAEPPKKGRSSGTFEPEGQPNFSYTVETTDQKLKYRIKTQARAETLRDLKICRVQIAYDNQRGKESHPVDVYLVIPQLERFSFQSKLRNELFSASEGM